MSKKHNLYISFSSEDNGRKGSANGWIDDFVRYLTVYIQRINNESPEIILLDESEKRPSSLGDEDGLILIVSDNYLKGKSPKADISLIRDPSRVFKIDLSPIKKSAQPREIRVLNEFHFYQVDVNSDQEYITLDGQNEGQNFWLKIIDLAFEINRVVYHKNQPQGNEQSRVIYLAETSYDQVNNRDEIKRELIRHGHTVLPSSPFSGDLNEFKTQVMDCLEKADLSVHIIGNLYGETTEGSDKSIVEIQNQLSTEYFAKNKNAANQSLHRLIWMPLFLKPKSDQQKLYLDQLKDDIVSTAGAEIIQTPLEILKTVIHSRLQIFDSESKARSKGGARSEIKSVYLLFDKKDANEISSLAKDISNRNFEVILPTFEDKQIEFLKSHRESLVKSDAVLLFANKNLNWVNSKLNDVIKAPGFGKQFPFDAKAIYIKDQSVSKDKIAAFGDLLMFNGEDNKTDLKPFLDKISSK